MKQYSKIIFTYILILFLGYQAQAQIEIGAYASRNWQLNQHNNIETRSQSVGFMGHYTLKNNVDLSFGLLYNNTDIGEVLAKKFFEPCLVDPPQYMDVQAGNIEVQTQLRYRFFNTKRISYFVSIGASQLFKVGDFMEGYLIPNNVRGNKESILEQEPKLELMYRITPILGAGGKIKLNEIYSLELAYDLRRFSKKEVSYTNKYFLGLSASVVKKIGKKE